MIAMALDTWIALGLVALAAAWLVRRGVRTLSKKGGSCDCPSSGGACGPSGSMANDLRRAAARGVEKAEHEKAASPPPD